MVTKRNPDEGKRICSRESIAEPVYLTIISNRSIARVDIAEIETIEQDGRKMQIKASSGEYDCYGRIDSIAGMLVGRAFYRPMKSLVINLDKVLEISDGEIRMRSGEVLIMGRNNYSISKQAFKRYLLKYPPFDNYLRGERLAESSIEYELASGNLNEKYKLK